MLKLERRQAVQPFRPDGFVVSAGDGGQIDPVGRVRNESTLPGEVVTTSSNS